MKKVAIVGALWTSNFGDVLLAKLLKEKLESLGHSIIMPNASDKVKVESGLLEEKFTISEADIFLFCGGGYFSEPPGNSFKWAISRYKLLFKYATFCRIKKIPYSILGVGAGPINSNLAKSVIKHVCKGANLIALRDPTSVNAVSTLVPNTEIIEVADYVLSLKDKILLNDVDLSHKKIGFHITLNGGKYIPAVIDYLNNIDNNSDIYFIEDHPGEFSRVCEKYPEVKRFFDGNVLGYKDVDQFIHDMNELSCIVTSKLHVGIVASALGKKVCSIPYHAKVERLYASFDRSDLCLVDFNDKDKIADHIKYCLEAEPVSIPQILINKSREIDCIIEKIVNQ
ncbi:polysaccharide pyruvyl transferase family protein [Vibrio cyclitrophicus]|uniref:polysaccharide pyruvyl transferase family protein n=1 Tax=Vibrio cyclitrophicus TaxID=47951 RepID=UPI000318BC47|nr:polysaccharide pyruvyl transferase family protein [Vibrio cyclitrophicus]OED89918.1 hypothetical protein OAQ_18235 [Vibrio cyclitrophicus ZF30]PMF60105.1 hypothetical protein BCV12_21405 [Vibrio cyclitrophicus]PMP56346.1 hypothetical protein BCS84_09870 [Vibrio cyclitrophicus]